MTRRMFFYTICAAVHVRANPTGRIFHVYTPAQLQRALHATAPRFIQLHRSIVLESAITVVGGERIRW